MFSEVTVGDKQKEPVRDSDELSDPRWCVLLPGASAHFPCTLLYDPHSSTVQEAMVLGQRFWMKIAHLHSERRHKPFCSPETSYFAPSSSGRAAFSSPEPEISTFDAPWSL